MLELVLVAFQKPHPIFILSLHKTVIHLGEILHNHVTHSQVKYFLGLKKQSKTQLRTAKQEGERGIYQNAFSSVPFPCCRHYHLPGQNIQQAPLMCPSLSECDHYQFFILLPRNTS